MNLAGRALGPLVKGLTPKLCIFISLVWRYFFDKLHQELIIRLLLHQVLFKKALYVIRITDLLSLLFVCYRRKPSAIVFGYPLLDLVDQLIFIHILLSFHIPHLWLEQLYVFSSHIFIFISHYSWTVVILNEFVYLDDFVSLWLTKVIQIIDLGHILCHLCHELI